jgi:hypothetical protein
MSYRQVIAFSLSALGGLGRNDLRGEFCPPKADRIQSRENAMTCLLVCLYYL